MHFSSAQNTRENGVKERDGRKTLHNVGAVGGPRGQPVLKSRHNRPSVTPSRARAPPYARTIFYYHYVYVYRFAHH